jgi:hypothetical protein
MNKTISIQREKLNKRVAENERIKNYIKNRRKNDPDYAQKLRDYQQEKYTSKGYGKRYNVGKVTHVCPQCLKEFEAGPCCVFCSSNCNATWKYQNVPGVKERVIKYQEKYRPGYMKKNRKRINAERRKPIVDHVCKECNKPFKARESREFCTYSCRARFKYREKRNEIMRKAITQGIVKRRGTKQWVKI